MYGYAVCRRAACAPTRDNYTMATTPINIELLAPAKNLETGKAAIDSGADAVYIGAPRFGARQAVGNTIEDIRELADYAHIFGCKVWVTLNTILHDDELPAATALAWQLYEAGADGLLIQDMGLLEQDLPPIRLHASTQCHNTSVEKVQWLEQLGIQRVVLARELSLEEIKDIRSHTKVELEAFVHGALCVSYSGQCYLSEAVCGRSANRGCCAQMCRQRYDLLDKDGNEIAHQQYLLSLHDMDRSLYLEELLQAGVTSLKIEGRLKDTDYVRNVVGYYRQCLDRIFSRENSPYKRASQGNIYLGFTPQTEKTFHRGSTDYFLHGRTRHLANWATPKSTGEHLGKIVSIERNALLLRTGKPLHNGDGLCFADQGFSVNTAVPTREKDVWRIVPNRMPDLSIGEDIYRNTDKAFTDRLRNTRSVRKLPIDICLSETEEGFLLQMGEHTMEFRHEKTVAQKKEQALQNIRTQLSKLGDTPYEAKSVTLQLQDAWFLPVSVLNEWRRRCLASGSAMSDNDKRNAATAESSNHQIAKLSARPALPEQPHDYRLNILNQAAKRFYAECGAEDTEPAFEISHDHGAALMTCKYCILYETGMCRKHTTADERKREPAFIRTNGKVFRLVFDCKECVMRIVEEMRR